MKSRDLTEFAAIPVVAVVLGALAVIMLAFDAGLWAWLLVGLSSAVVAAVVIRMAASRRVHPPASAAPPTRPRRTAPGPGESFRVLVVADDCATSSGFVEAIVAHADGRPVEALVVAPALGSRLARWTSDDGAYVDAQRHLDATLAALQAAGITATGHIGSHDPVQAADDGLRELPADEIVFVTHPPASASRLEADVDEAARARYALPVTHLVVEHGD
jgi:peptidyl-tRNA hydrolase